jgi:hypothetical protein
VRAESRDQKAEILAEPFLLSDLCFLTSQVLERIGTPRDHFEITAQLEVMGLRDADARALYGHRDLFELGRAIEQLVQQGAVVPPIEPEDPPRKQPSFLRHYITGSMFAIPMLLQAAAILTWGYGLWGALDVDVRTGTAIALGFITSYVISGGFVQAIVRRGLFYVYQQEPALARWVVLRGWWLGARVTLGLLVPAFLFNALYRLLPWDLFFIAALYYAALSLLWLNWSMIYIAASRLWLALTTAIGLGVVIVAARALGWPVIAANAAGLLAAAAISFIAGVRALGPRGRAVNPPRLTVLVYATSRYFLYGLLYNLFVFLDRVLAWTTRTGREDFPPYSFWLSARYELGMDLALVVVILLAGVVEASIQTFSSSLVPVEKSLASTERARFAEWFRAFYRRRVAILAVAAIGAVVIARTIVTLVAKLPNPQIQASLHTMTATFAFWAGAAGYALLMLALQNLLLLLTLSRVELAARAVAIALGIDAVAGFVASRAFHYSMASLGLVAGALALFAITWRDIRRVGDDLDYHYFSAF